ncbi:MAG: PH domain-containing protein [Thermoleophilia bacterium]|nr:PH domain-containing protein [Thermoleophilia bacterium]
MTGAAAEGRLHPLAAVLYGVRVIRNTVPLLLAGLVTDVPRPVLAVAIAAVLLAGVPYGLLSWWRFRYRVEAGRLVVDAGVLVRRNRVVPLERIRGVSLDEPVLHRVFGLVRARVEAAAAGDQKGELALAAVSRDQAERLRDAVLRAGDAPAATAAAAAPPPLAAMRPGRLALAGATSARFVLVPAAAAGGLLNFADDVGLDGLLRDGAGRVADRAPHSAVSIALAVAAAAVFVTLLAAAGSVIADWAFELRAEGPRLATVRGLLSRRRTTVDRRRVLGVEVCDSPVRRALGMAAIVAPVGGFGVSKDGDSAGRVRLLPLADADEIARVTAEVAPGDAPPLLPHPRSGLPRRVGRATVPPLAVAIGAAVLGWWWVAGLAALAAAAMVPVAFDRHRNLGHAAGRWLVLRSGSLARRHSRLDPGAIVATRVRSSPFQRRRGLCSVQVHLGLGAGSRTAIDMGEDQGRALLARLHPWMREG